MNVWRPVVDHVEEQLGLGRLCTVEGDAWFLPDTVGVSYGDGPRQDDDRPGRLDRAGRTLGYFHNAGYFELGGDDFDGIFRLGRPRRPDGPAPYVERIRLDRVRRDDPDLVERVVALARHHLAPAPGRQPDAAGWRPGCGRTCRGWPPRTSRPSTSTPSASAASAGPAPSWPPPSSSGSTHHDGPGVAPAALRSARWPRGEAAPVRHGPRGPGPDRRPRTACSGEMAGHWDDAMGVLEARYGGA